MLPNHDEVVRLNLGFEPETAVSGPMLLQTDYVLSRILPSLAQLFSMKRLQLLLLSLCVAGCDRGKQHAASFDALLSTGQIDRVEFISDETGKTNDLTGDRARALLGEFAPNARVPCEPPESNYAVGRVFLFHGDRQVGWGLDYIPSHNCLAFGYHYFRPRGTNNLRGFFE
ncbi:MAG: hypothetical protein JWM16_3836 [Verrucomicrobiales bacterium]|nr:hypothetical protein [Verrucomicrobiales bacterium]